MTHEDTDIGGADVGFRSTHWSLVVEAGTGSREAGQKLIGDYWKPVYFFIRRRGRDVEAAKDLTQSFFLAVLERSTLRQFDPQRGRFRTFILAALRHFLSNERDRAGALKRGGDFNFVEAEADLASAAPTPAEAFEREWARGVMARAVEKLAALVPAEDMALLDGEGPALPPDEKKYRLRRLRMKLRQCLEEEVLPTVERAPEVPSEIRDLFGALGAP